MGHNFMNSEMRDMIFMRSADNRGKLQKFMLVDMRRENSLIFNFLQDSGLQEKRII